jgi:hypothetical protein
VLWSQPDLQVGKQVVVAWSKIRNIRRMVKQLSVEMLQQCSSVRSCMRTCIVTEVHTGCHHSTPFVLNDPTQFFSVSQYTFGRHFEQDHHSLQMADQFTLHCEHLFAHFWTFYTIILQFLHSLQFGHKLCIIHHGFPHRSYF